MKKILYLIPMLVAGMMACSRSGHVSIDNPDSTATGLKPEAFEDTVNGRNTHLIVISTDSIEVCVSDYGARIVSIAVPGRDGVLRNVVASHSDIAAYKADSTQLGAVRGRFGGKIFSKKVLVGTDTISIADNTSSWADSVWDIAAVSDTSVTLRMASIEGDGGFAGNAGVQIDFKVRGSQLTIDYTAVADTTTLFDIFHSLAFNLNGSDSATPSSVDSHNLTVLSDQYIYIDSVGRPNGDMLMSIWTPYDFTQPHALSSVLARSGDFEQIRWGKGINAFFVARPNAEGAMFTLTSPQSGITMNITTTTPGIGVRVPQKPQYVTVEPHLYPDAPNHRGWGTKGTYKKGDVFSEIITFTFSVN